MYYQNENDETLVMLTLAGEQRAYEVLVTRYQKLVISSAMSVTKKHFMAEDAAQDAFVTAWMKLDTLKEPQKYSSWVCRIAKNCALNMITRYRSFLPMDVIENLNLSDNGAENPAEIYALSEEHKEVDKSLERLPEKVREIIHLHYFEGLSIADIADRMRISEGTVKWQLHDGRKRLRKELCAMNEKYNDTLVERVMKKVEELKLWQFKNDKSGFEKIYCEVLKEVEELPESEKKQHALADVLMRGWWWIDGKKNDELFARIVDAAIEGKNEEVMTFIVSREDSKVYGGNRIDFIRDKQIPRLDKAGFIKTLGREWFWLGYYLLKDGKAEEGNAAFDKVEEILSMEDAYRILVPYAKRMFDIVNTRYKDLVDERYSIGGTVQEYRITDGNPLYWSQKDCERGNLVSIDYNAMYIFSNASCCDGQFFADIAVGESIIGSDGTKLTFVSDNESVHTPAGKFEYCKLWETRRWWENSRKIICRTYYKEGIGIVRQEHITNGIGVCHDLIRYDIKSGSGLLPFKHGNTWEYKCDYSPEAISYELEIKVAFADDERILLSYWNNIERLRYDENSWVDAVQEIANDYCQSMNGGFSYICDVYPAMARAEALAKTPIEKAHTKAAVSVAKTILETDTKFNPNYTATGHWNFFNRNYIRKKNDTLIITEYDCRWGFEWKNTSGMDPAVTPLLFNDVLEILQDAANCLWSDEWRIGASPIVEYNSFNNVVKTQLVCENGGTITTKAGTFENCFKLSLDIGGMNDGWSYRGGKKVYYFAEGIGIVRTESEYCSGTKTAVYELTSYDGRGVGYMPISDGFMRRYDALGLTDGFEASATYTFLADEDGDIVVFSDRKGIRVLPPPITTYSSIHSEVIEDQLWEAKKHNESRLCHDVNNFHIMCHFLGRDSRYWAAPDKAIAWNKYKLQVLEGFGYGTVPDAWLGLYASTTFRTACALFGKGKKDEGYEWLEKAFEVFPKWDSIPNDTELEVGDPLIFSGIKLIKGKNLIKLPDGTLEAVTYGFMFKDTCKLMHYGMTAKRGWEWFNSVRDEERFKEYIKRAEIMLENLKK